MQLTEHGNCTTLYMQTKMAVNSCQLSISLMGCLPSNTWGYYSSCYFYGAHSFDRKPRFNVYCYYGYSIYLISLVWNTAELKKIKVVDNFWLQSRAIMVLSSDIFNVFEQSSSNNFKTLTNSQVNVIFIF